MVSARAFRVEETSANCIYPRLMGTEGAVACESHLATHAGSDVLKAGGNAVDAMVAGVLVEGLVDPHMNTLGGECPIIIAMADREPIVINGNTVAPMAASREALRERGYSEVPDAGVLAAGVPATLSALLLALERFGTWSFADVSHAARKLARQGFPVHRGLIRQHKFGLDAIRERVLREWPQTEALYYRDGKPLAEGDLLVNADFADLMEMLADAETRSADRSAGIRAVHAAFYEGEPAVAIDRFVSERDGFLKAGDLARYRAKLEQPVAQEFAGATLYKCGYWNQGPALLQSLAILKARNVERYAHNSAEYVHLVLEAMKLAFADREQYFGDPDFHDIPAAELLSPDYVALRADLIDMARASLDFVPGDPVAVNAILPRDKRVPWGGWGSGTVHVDTADRHGNMVSATPSGAWIASSEVVPGLGFPLGNRLMTFHMEPENHPNLIAGGRMPRTTISPSVAYSDGKPWLAFGSMGGDQQDQWQLQFYLNCVLFGMTPQQAIEAPKFSTDHCPGFFAPHSSEQAHVRVERGVGEDVLADLSSRGHAVDPAPDWTEGFLLCVAVDPRSGVLEAACDPRCTKSEIFTPAAMAW